MKRLLLPLLLAAACGGPSHGDDQADDAPDAAVPDSNPSNPGIHVAWNLTAGGSAAVCPTGATTAALYAQRAADPEPFVDLYDCSLGEGDIGDLPAGGYTVWVELTDDLGTTVYAQSDTADITVESELAYASFDIDLGAGSFTVAWQLHTSGGAATTCAAVTNDGVSILQTNNTTTEGSDDIWNCTDGEAPASVTDTGLAVGPYTIDMTVLDASQAAIGEAPLVTTEITHDGENVDLGTQTITLF